MKKVAIILLLLLAIESYGVWGAAEARHITVTCTLEVGPLCYAWEPSAIGKILGADGSHDLEAALAKARKSWEDEFVERAMEAKKSGASGFQHALDDATRAMKRGLRDIGDKIKDAAQ